MSAGILRDSPVGVATIIASETSYSIVVGCTCISIKEFWIRSCQDTMHSFIIPWKCNSRALHKF